MKRKKVVKKAEEVKAGAEGKVETELEATSEQQELKHQKRSPWDDLVFMRPKPQPEPTVQTEAAEEEMGTTSTDKAIRRGWSWI